MTLKKIKSDVISLPYFITVNTLTFQEKGEIIPTYSLSHNHTHGFLIVQFLAPFFFGIAHDFLFRGYVRAVREVTVIDTARFRDLNKIGRYS